MEKNCLHEYGYIILPPLSGHLEMDVQSILEANQHTQTYLHVKKVAETSVIIGEHYGLEIGSCLMSGLLHDISTIIKPVDMLDFAHKQHMPIDKAEMQYPSLLHQRLSAVLAGKIFEITDAEVLSAIACHTTLKAHPSKLDMVLFTADKLSWDQEGKPPFYDAIIQGLSVSLEKACYAYIAYMLKHDHIRFPHQWLLEAKAFLETIL